MFQFLTLPSAMAKPRSPLPPWPEIPLQRWDFDAAYWASLSEAESPAAGFGDFAESWSGFALQRDGLSVSPIVMPGVDANGRTNIAAQGTIRFWFSPSWSSADMGGTGPGYYARLIELVTADGKSVAVAWSLYASPDGSTLFLSGQGGQGVADILEAKIPFEAGRWYLLALNYSAKDTALYVNAELVAEGSGLAAVNPASVGLVVGSDGTGGNLAGGLFDEVTTFGEPVTPEDQALYYNGVSGQAALGPISAAEEAAQQAAAAKRLAEQEAAAMMRYAWSQPAMECVTNVPVYLTNLVSVFDTNNGWTVTFTIEGGTNGVPYDIYSTTNLTGDGDTHSQWLWLDQGYTCTTYTFTNQADSQAYYVLGVTNDFDGDGLSDAFELLVSKTLTTTNDTDGDALPDGWEVHNGLNPLVNDASDDPDGDWSTNLQEYQAGTNPHDTMVIAWGKNGDGQCNVPLYLRNVTSFAGGLYHSLVLQSNGVVTAWGGNSNGQTDIGLSNALAIAASWNQSAAVKADGTVTNWGDTYGQMPVNLTNARSVAVGVSHTLALRQDGTVVAWGDNSEGQTNAPAGLSSVKAIAAGWYHNVALLSNSTVAAWGTGSLDATNVPSGLSNVIAIAAGAFHTLALKADETVVAWGAGWTNEVGSIWHFGQSIVPAALTNVVAIAAGGNSSLALKRDGTTLGWGDNLFGQGTAPSGVSNLTAIAAGVQHSLAIRTGRLTPLILQQPSNQAAPAGSNVTFTAFGYGLAEVHYQWQFNGTNLAQATNATLTLMNVQTNDVGDYRVAIATGAGTNMSSVATFTLITRPGIASQTQPDRQWVPFGGNLSLMVNATAPAQWASPLGYQWKSNGIIIASTTASNYLVSYFATEEERQYQVVVTNAAGSTNSTLWKVKSFKPGGVATWGSDGAGELDWPADATNVSAIAAGEFHSVAITEAGTAVQWGEYWTGSEFFPVGTAPALSNLVAVAAGAEHDLGLKADGTVVSWGLSNAVANFVPANLVGVKAIAAGWDHNVALKTNGTVVVWGSNLFGQTNAPPNLTNITAIAAGAQHSLALRADGTVVAWGYSPSGQTNVPGGLSNVVAVAAGGQHSLALKQDGQVVAWGYGNDGQCAVPSGLSNVMAIAAGWAHSVALKNDGTAIAWGNNSSGQTNVGGGLSGIKAIAAGGDHTLAMIFSPLVQYQLDVTKDLLLIYNTNSTDSSNVCAYYLAHRPMVSAANVLGIGCTNAEIITSVIFTNQILAPYLGWLESNPTKRPQYVLAFLDIPSRVHGDTNAVGSVFYQLHEKTPGSRPFVTTINMATVADCTNYINKLAAFGTNGQVLISASAGGYGNTNYVVDNVRHWTYEVFGSTVSQATNGLLSAGVSPNSISYLDGVETCIQWETNIVEGETNISCTEIQVLSHITNSVSVAGYICWGYHSSLASQYAVNGLVQWSGASGWWIIETIESHNGQRASDSGNFMQWYSTNAFGGANYSNTPVGAVTHVDEPSLGGANDSYKYFNLWAGGKNFAICAWNSRKTDKFQAVGDPWVRK